ncbi:uncharacterized protein LOC114130157 [Aphis gossypii]|uniref:Uncharacterized protein n=1 Tax=Aphis gossypii TaxID=80765 RepID=A0A9P0JA21_APHGO|nr:uncharacterized protein LOC114130157 [Aphis gossypii]CAH1733201.1 unnamed protein product [Aphis gossypii]CAH1733240.1 unnamed protein product [Aphis gossypii]
MTTSVTIMLICILGPTLLLIMPDNTTASDKFFQTGGRFGKRHDDRIPADYRYAAMIKTRSVDNVPPRIERGFYISRYGKRSTNSITDPYYFTLCLPSYGIYCDFTGLPNLLRCKRIHPTACSNLNYVNDKIQMKPDNDITI